jgi:hypothetical protein
MTQKTDDEIRAIISSQLADAKSYTGSSIQNKREWALRYFNGEVDFPAMGENRSKFVSRDVADMHGLIMPSLLRIFFGSPRMVIYEPTRKEHEEYAEQATDYVNYVVMRRCDGYRQFRDSFSDAILMGNAVVKHWWDDTPVYETDDYTGQSEDAYKYVISDPDIEEVLNVKEYPDPDWVPPPPPQPQMQPPMPGDLPPELIAAAEAGDPAAIEQIDQVAAQAQAQSQPMPEPEMAPMLYDFTIKRRKPNFGLRVAAVPLEEFVIGRSEKVLDEKVRFCAHSQRKTRSELIEEGYPRELVESIPKFHDIDRDRRAAARDETEEFDTGTAADTSTEYVEIHECFVLLDTDGDGIAERRRVVMAGSDTSGIILSNDEWGDDLPFSDITPDPRAHSFVGHGIYDELKDIQDIKTVGGRGFLDNFYNTLKPTLDVEEGAYLNPDALLDPDAGEVFWRKVGSPPMQVNVTPSIAPQAFQVLEYMDSIAEKRTGVSQRSTTADMDTLQNQTATATNAVQAATHAKVEEYARNIAQCGGLRRIFGCILRLIIKHAEGAETVRLRGKLVENIDPRSWNADMDVTINTGLGTGTREKDVAILQGITVKMEQLLQQFGPFNEEINVGHLMMAYQKMAEAAGIENADAFFPDLTQDRIKELRDMQQKSQEGQKPQDPALAKLQAEMQLKTQQAQAEMQAQQAKDAQNAQMEMAKAQRDAQREMEKAQFQMQLERERAQLQIELEREKALADIELRRQIAQMDHQLKIEELQLEASLTAEANVMKQSNGFAPDLNIQEQGI